MAKGKGNGTDFLRRFGFEGLYNGLSVTRKLDEDRLATISLSTSNGQTLPTSGHYVSLKVKVVDKRKGKIDEQTFVFDDHLDKGDRKDKRTDHPDGGGRTFQVIEYCGWDWYIAVPRSLGPLKGAVEGYLLMFA